MNKGWIVAGAVLACGFGARAADFINLDFEEYVPDEYGFFAQVPGWGDLIYNMVPLDAAAIALHTTNSAYVVPLEGGASLFLGTGYLLYTNEIHVAQTADVPTNAAQIRFLTTLPGVAATLGGVPLTATVPDEPLPGVYRYATDVSALAGQTAELKIALGDGENGMYLLDQIEFLNAEGAVVWPVPRPRPPICLEDFHAATLNASLWDVAIVGQSNTCSIDAGRLWMTVLTPVEPFETTCRFRSALRGDWDVRLDYWLNSLIPPISTNPGAIGMSLAADFGPERTATASVGHAVVISNQSWFFGTDWGPGFGDWTATTNKTGKFRLVRSGGEVAGYVWDATSNDWRIVGAANGYTDDLARVGVRVWCTGRYGGKSAHVYADDLVLADGQASLDGLAIKTFGLDAEGQPAIDWNAVGIPASNRYVVTRATSLVGSAWTQVSGQIPDSGGDTNWTGANPGSGSFYYRVESVPGP